jgi:L-ascorbate metabolism protein UlaG (beta-lactamase superfamily)
LRIKWLGHSCFQVTDARGFRVLTDPYEVPRRPGMPLRFTYPPLDVAADLVLVSHDHFDHNAVHAVRGDPAALREPGEHRVGDVTARGVAGEHDPEGGRVRGRNLLWRWEQDGVSLCHLGDFGQAALRPEQADALRPVDVLFVPVGGGPVADARGAKELVGLLQPHLVFPMHYRTAFVDFGEPVEGFLRLMGTVRREEADVVELTPEQIRVARGDAVVLRPPGG